MKELTATADEYLVHLERIRTNYDREVRVLARLQEYVIR